MTNSCIPIQFSSVQSLSCIRLFVTPWTAAWQASQSITNSQSLLKLMSIELAMPSNHLILCCPLLPPSIFPSIRVFLNESALRIRWSSIGVSASTSVLPMKIQTNFLQDGLAGSSFNPGTLKSTTVQKHQFFGAQFYLLERVKVQNTNNSKC